MGTRQGKVEDWAHE